MAQSITINNQTVSVGNHRAYIFLDDGGKRYAVTGPMEWERIIGTPLDDILTKIHFNTNTGKLTAYSLLSPNAVKQTFDLT
jgi:hypothetical protein